MYKTLKTYAVHGMLEYTCLIPMGSYAKLRVPFTGGTQAGLGNRPATYTTDDPVRQWAIEHSTDYATGRITLHSSHPTDIPLQPGCNPQPAAAAAGTASNTECENDKQAKQPVQAQEQTAETTLSFPGIDAAKDHLRDAYGADCANMRKSELLSYAAATYGLTIKIG